MVKHFKTLSGVLLIGDKPEWYTGDHIPMADTLCPDNPARVWKERSMQLKVMACPDEVFLYSNDDYYALQDFTDTPAYFDTTCGNMAANHSMESYKRMYDNCLPHWLNFDVHTPMIIDRDKFREAFEAMDEQTPIKTTYGNYLKFKGEYYYDVKIRQDNTYDEIMYTIKDRPFFSTHNSCLNDNMMKVFEELYPNKSAYEL